MNLPPFNPTPNAAPARQHSEEGFALIALIVAIFVILIFLSIAAPKVSRDLRRDRELESIQRGNQYVRAIQLYYRKFGRYPASMEQLEKSNNIRFLRQQYVDPMTGKSDWRLILVGQNKTTVKGLFGQPLAGLPGTGVGISGTSTPGVAAGAANQQSSFGGASTGAAGASTSFGTPSGASGTASGGSNFGQTGGQAGSASSGSAFGASTTGSTTAGSPATGGLGSQSATDFKGAGGPFMGIGHTFTGDSIVTLNEQTDYGTWEFLYDPRIEQLKAKSSLFGGGAATSATSNSLSSFGSSNPGGATNPGGASPASPGSQTTPAPTTTPPPPPPTQP